MTTLGAGWVLWTIGLSLLAGMTALVYLAWWALFSDRPGERRRCPRCWYDLTYSPGMGCPECGFVGQAEKDFKKIRQRRRIALLAIFGCTGIGLYVVDHANSQGWTSYVPTRGLIAVMPFVENPRGTVFADINRRIKGGGLSDGQWLAIMTRCAHGDETAPPPGPAWTEKYGDMLTLLVRQASLQRAEHLRESAETLLLDIPPDLQFATRAVWPANVPPTIDVQARHWWPAGVQWRVRAQPDIPDAAADVHILRDRPIQGRSYSIVLPTLAPGEHVITLDLALERRVNEDSPWEVLESRFAKLPLHVKGGLGDYLTPVGSDEVERAMRRVMRLGIAKWSEGSLPVRVRVDQRQTFQPLFDDMAIGAQIEVYRNGRFGRRLDLWWLAGTGSMNRQNAWEVPEHDDAVLVAPDDPDDVWTVHVVSRPDLALRVEGATKYWEGEFTMRIPVSTQNGAAPPRGWVMDATVQ